MNTCSIESLFDVPARNSALVATPSVSQFASRLRIRLFPDFASLPEYIERLIIIGGGTLIDEAKFWKYTEAPNTELIAIPSIWGSGAEVSPVAVRNSGMHKDILIDPALVPEYACFWPELAETVPEELAKYACGDSWSHAIEGFLSPLADKMLQKDLSSVIRQMLELPLSRDPHWFEPSARACAGQARSSVGLVHGIAHTLENRLRQNFQQFEWGHARLCSVFLWPVMQFNCLHSNKWKNLSDEFDIDSHAVFNVLRQLFDIEAYNQALPLLDEHWMEIVKDPCSRTNSSLVRPASKAFFLEQFQP